MSIRILHISETEEAFRRASLLIGETRYDIEFIESCDTALTVADDDMEDTVKSELWQIKIEGSDNLKIRISPHCPWRPGRLEVKASCSPSLEYEPLMDKVNVVIRQLSVFLDNLYFNIISLYFGDWLLQLSDILEDFSLNVVPDTWHPED